MTAFLAVVCVVAALLLGAVVGWAMRKHAHWCPVCGGRLTCVLCQQVSREVVRTGYLARGRAVVIPLDDGNPGPGDLSDEARNRTNLGKGHRNGRGGHR